MAEKPKTIISKLRKEYHNEILCRILTTRKGSVALSIADKHSTTSVDLSKRMVQKIGMASCPRIVTGQESGTLFAQITKDFLQKCLDQLSHLKPVSWIFSASQVRPGIAGFEQYEHLQLLKKAMDKNKELRATFGGDYFITPDITISRNPLLDSEINKKKSLVSKHVPISRLTPVRSENRDNSSPILHASISCKWTMRSDRSQNTRTEALNLIRNRKGRVPHIMAVVFEPMPTRLASIAMGTGDVDCTYHVALYELMDAVKESGNADQEEMLSTLVEGRRLRDISDLPFDLLI